jgi:hypothetical protein
VVAAGPEDARKFREVNDEFALRLELNETAVGPMINHFTSAAWTQSRGGLLLLVTEMFRGS